MKTPYTRILFGITTFLLWFSPLFGQVSPIRSNAVSESYFTASDSKTYNNSYLASHLQDVAYRFSVNSNQSGSQDINIYPNPASDYVKVSWYAETDGNAVIKLLDNIGNAVITKEVEASRGQNQYTLDLSVQEVRSGIYFLQLQTELQKITRKLVVRR